MGSPTSRYWIMKILAQGLGPVCRREKVSLPLKPSLFPSPLPSSLSSVAQRSSVKKNPLDPVLLNSVAFSHQFQPQFLSQTRWYRMPEVDLQSSPSKRPLSANSSPVKKLKFTEEEDKNMPSVDSTETKGEVLKEIGNKGSPVKALKEEAGTKLYFVKMTEKAHVPSKGSKLAAGYDLKSAYKYTVPKRGSCLVKTDIQIKLPSGTYGRVAPRSGLALKHKIDVGAGVIDEDYRGNVGVILFNHADEDFEVNEGDRVAQLICEKITYPDAVEVESLDDTERGEGGFGSTGVNSGVSA